MKLVIYIFSSLFILASLLMMAGAKQVELMRGQLKAMENYKFFLSCRIADLALSDFEPSEEKKGA